MKTWEKIILMAVPFLLIVLGFYVYWIQNRPNKQQWPMVPSLYSGYPADQIMEIWGTPKKIYKRGDEVIQLEYTDGNRHVWFWFIRKGRFIWPYCENVDTYGPEVTSFNPWKGTISKKSKIIDYNLED